MFLPQIRVRKKYQSKGEEEDKGYFQRNPIVPPPILVTHVDDVELYTSFKIRKRKEYESRHKARLLNQHPSGLRNFKTPQTSRLSLDEEEQRIMARKRKEDSTRKVAIRMEKEKRELSSKYSGYNDTSPIVIVKKQPKKFVPGMKHVKTSLKEARLAQQKYELRLQLQSLNTRKKKISSSSTSSPVVPGTSPCEEELFNVASRLANTYKIEWSRWNTYRAFTLQKNARIHIDRTVLHYYNTRSKECNELIVKHRLKIRNAKLKTYLKAWHYIANKRFSFRAFLIRCLVGCQDGRRRRCCDFDDHIFDPNVLSVFGLTGENSAR